MANDIQFKTGLVPDLPDGRDFRLATYVDLDVAVPAVWMQPRHGVSYQANLGSCVAFTGARANEHLHDVTNKLNLSEQRLYGLCKERDGLPPEIEGTYTRTMLDVLREVGCPREQFQPYEGRYPPAHPPLEGWREDAARYRIGSYAYVSGGLEQLKQARYVNGPLAIAVKVHDSFTRTGRDGIVPMPYGSLLGGHAMCWDLGWDERGIEVANSWSDRWADGGHCFISARVWDAIGMGAWTVIDETLVPLHWTDWPYDELPPEQRAEARLAQDEVWRAEVFWGRTPTLFDPWSKVLERQVVAVATRLGIDGVRWRSEWALATRGWVRDCIPGLTWKEERWDETLTRFQLALLVARKLQGR